MRTPGSLGSLLPVAIPGLILTGAIVILVTSTRLGPVAFNGPWAPLVLGIVTGAIVLGYLVAALQERLAARPGPWSLPHATLASGTHDTVTIHGESLERLGFTAEHPLIEAPHGTLYALERSLSGAWGTPEGAGWDRVAYLQRVVLALFASALLALLFVVGSVVATSRLDPGLRGHAGLVLIGGLLAGWLLLGFVARARRESALELFTDAGALLWDRGNVGDVEGLLASMGVFVPYEHEAVER